MNMPSKGYVLGGMSAFYFPNLWETDLVSWNVDVNMDRGYLEPARSPLSQVSENLTDEDLRVVLLGINR